MNSLTLFKEKTIRDYLIVFFRYKKIILISFIVVVVTVLIGLQFKTPVYEAQVKMLISGEKQIESEYYREDIRSRFSTLTTQSEIVKSVPVLEKAVKVLYLDRRPFDYERNFCSPLKNLVYEYKEKLSKNRSKFSQNVNTVYNENIIKIAIAYLQDNIVITPIQDTNMFVIRVTDYSPEQAAAIANVVSRSYIIFDLQQQLVEVQTKYGFRHPSVQQLRESIFQMDSILSRHRVSVLEAIGPASVKVIEQADIPSDPKSSGKQKIFIMAIILSLFLGIGISLVIELLNQSIRNPQEIVNILNIPMLGSIPHKSIKDKKIIEDVNFNSKYIKFYKELCDQVNIFMLTQNVKSILFTSTVRGEGVSTIVSNLSICFANELGRKTLLIDANIREPSIHDKLNLGNDSGLIDIMNGKKDTKIIQDYNQNLDVITAGNITNIPLLLNKITKSETLLSYKNEYDAVFLDCAPLNEYADAVSMSASVDGVIFIVEEGKVRRQVILKSMEMLLKKNSKIIGAVLNKRTFPLPNIIYKNI